MPHRRSPLRGFLLLCLTLMGLFGCASQSLERPAPAQESSRRPLGLDIGSTDTVYPGKPDLGNLYTSNVIVVAAFAEESDDGCSGVLIAPNQVLTAAHCVCKKREATSSDREWVASRLNKAVPSHGEDAAATQPIEDWKSFVLGNTHSIFDTSGCAKQVEVTAIHFVASTRRYLPSPYKAVKVLPHPLFLGVADAQNHGLFREADLALIQLSESVTESFRPIQWPDREVFQSQEIVMVGYGLGETEYPSAAMNPYRHYGDSRITHIEHFESGSTRFATDDQDSLGHEFSRNYEGDSGGGVFSKVDDSVLVGIISARRDGKGGVFESVYPHLQWLKGGARL